MLRKLVISPLISGIKPKMITMTHSPKKVIVDFMARKLTKSLSFSSTRNIIPVIGPTG